MKNSNSVKIVNQCDRSEVTPTKNFQKNSFIENKKNPYFCKTFKKKNLTNKCVYFISPKKENNDSSEKKYETKTLVARFGKRFILDEYLIGAQTSKINEKKEKNIHSFYHSRVNTEIINNSIQNTQTNHHIIEKSYEKHNYRLKEVKDLKYTIPKIKELNKKNLFPNAVKICDKKKIKFNKNNEKIKNLKGLQNSYSAAKLGNSKISFCVNNTYNKNKNKNSKRKINTKSHVDTYTKKTKNCNYIVTVTTTVTEIPNSQDTDEGIRLEEPIRCTQNNYNKKIYHKNCLSDFNFFESNEKNNINKIRKFNYCPIHGKSTWTYKNIM